MTPGVAVARDADVIRPTLSAMPSPPMITVARVVKEIGGVRVLGPLDFVVERGDIVALIGSNGAGKSTLGRIVCTLSTPTSGRLTVAGFDAVRDRTEVRRRIGVAFQNAAIDPRESGHQLLKLHAQLQGLRRREATERIAELLTIIDLGRAIDQPVGTYSGGSRRRLDLAIAMLHQPDFLFLDEPTSGLDPASRASVWSEVRRLNLQLGVTVLFTTQFLDEADSLADHVGVLYRGKLVAEGSPAELKQTLGGETITIGTGGVTSAALRMLERLVGVASIGCDGDSITVETNQSGVGVDRITAILVRSDVKVRSVVIRSRTLDEVLAHHVHADPGTLG